MRRRITTPPEPLLAPPKVATSWTFDLETITPVLGGGVRPFEPDTVDIVRVPSIRGHLRWWWRALVATTEDLKHPKALLRREAKLWGGLTDDEPVRSQVRITVDVLSRGQVVAAGHHAWRDGKDGKPGRHIPFPDWKDPPLGYGLFPLMRDAEFLKQSSSQAKRVATRSLRQSLVFRIVVGFDALTEQEQLQLTATLWMWIHFGGIGARTRRGFGALAIKHCALPAGDWQRLFDRNTRFLDRLRAVVSSLRKGAEDGALGERIAGAKLFIDDARPEPAIAAQGRILTKMWEFRQKPGCGRSKGTGNKPGPSHWPEANLLRAIYQKTIKLRPGQKLEWNHAPPKEIDATQFGAPRAAFGLPLEIKFKASDQKDTCANATIYPAEGLEQAGDLLRWPSPLLIRPIAGAAGKAHAAMLILSSAKSLSVPPFVRIKYANHPDQPKNGFTARVSMQGVDERLLQHRNGKPSQNALQAFWRFAQDGREWPSVDFKDLG